MRGSCGLDPRGFESLLTPAGADRAHSPLLQHRLIHIVEVVAVSTATMIGEF